MIQEKDNKTTAYKESRWNVFNFLSSLDIYGLPIPSFNIKGKDKVQTVVGGFLSAIVITLTLGYSITGIYDVISKSNPLINENIVYSYYGTEEDGLDLSKAN